MLTLGVSVSRSSNFLPRIGVVLTAVSFSVVLASVLAVSTVGVRGDRYAFLPLPRQLKEKVIVKCLADC